MDKIGSNQVDNRKRPTDMSTSTKRKVEEAGMEVGDLESTPSQNTRSQHQGGSFSQWRSVKKVVSTKVACNDLKKPKLEADHEPSVVQPPSESDQHAGDGETDKSLKGEGAATHEEVQQPHTEQHSQAVQCSPAPLPIRVKKESSENANLEMEVEGEVETNSQRTQPAPPPMESVSCGAVKTETEEEEELFHTTYLLNLRDPTYGIGHAGRMDCSLHVRETKNYFHILSFHEAFVGTFDRTEVASGKSVEYGVFETDNVFKPCRRMQFITVHNFEHIKPTNSEELNEKTPREMSIRRGHNVTFAYHGFVITVR